jgi:hypothetical protein
MIPRLAHALEALFGPSLSSAATGLSRAALVALIAAITIALARAALATAARRYGWERSWIVRCPGCGSLVADPRQTTCPSGHPVRFPPGAAQASQWRGRRARAAALYAILLSVLVAALSFFVYTWLRVGSLASPLARVTAASAFFFFLAALYAGDFALSPRPRGAGSRLLHGALALACLTPFLLLAPLSRSFEPTLGRLEGTVWGTPAGIYISDGKPRRLFPPAPAVEARVVEARVPALDWQWRGLSGFRLGSSEQPWRGSGGSFARWLDGSADTLRRHGVAVRRSTEEIPLPPNVKVRIVRRDDTFAFEPE